VNVISVIVTGQFTYYAPLLGSHFLGMETIEPEFYSSREVIIPNFTKKKSNNNHFA